MKSNDYSLFDEEQKAKLAALGDLTSSDKIKELAGGEASGGNPFLSGASKKIALPEFDGRIAPPEVQKFDPTMFLKDADKMAPILSALAASDKNCKKDIKKAGKKSISDFLRGK